MSLASRLPVRSSSPHRWPTARTPRCWPSIMGTRSSDPSTRTVDRIGHRASARGRAAERPAPPPTTTAGVGSRPGPGGGRPGRPAAGRRVRRRCCPTAGCWPRSTPIGRRWPGAGACRAAASTTRGTGRRGAREVARGDLAADRARRADQGADRRTGSAGSPRAEIEDFHAVRLIYRATCPAPRSRWCVDHGGTTESARWVPRPSGGSCAGRSTGNRSSANCWRRLSERRRAPSD